MDIKERIKFYLRKNKYYKKYLQTHVNDMRYFVRSCKYYFKYYSLKKDKEITGNTLFFIIDPHINHPGLSDRYKAIIGCYYIAKQNGFDFKIIFDTPFKLSDYLDVNNCDWRAEFKDLSYSLKNSRVIPYNGGGKLPRLSKKIKQYHVYSYIGYNILATNKIPDYNRVWGELYNSLFRPGEIVKSQIEETGFKEASYIAVHLRFVNALEHFEDNHYNYLSDEHKEKLIQRCIDGIKGILNKYQDLPVVVFSDSNIFLNRVQEALPVHVLKGEVGHISFNNAQKVILKTFLDFYMISNAKEVYIIKAAEMYGTVFSYYAAVAGYKEAIILEV